jgi:hypothetical protein
MSDSPVDITHERRFQEGIFILGDGHGGYDVETTHLIA